MTLEEKVDELCALVKTLVEDQRPQITFREICENLGYSRQGTTLWIERNKIKRLSKGRYCRISYIEAARKRAA